MNAPMPTASLPHIALPAATPLERLALALVLILHVGATCILLPPWEALRPEPLRFRDHGIHTHRVHVYRQGLLQSGLPWGYDPTLSAGVVVDPAQDIGAKPQQVLGVLLPFLPPGTIVRLFLFLATLTFPLWMLLSCRRLGLPTDTQVWVMVALLIPAWLYDNLQGYFLAGLASFAAASYFAPYVLSLFLLFLAQPGGRTYMAFLSTAAVLFLLHVEGPMVLLPVLIVYTLMARPLAWRWRTATLLAPLGIVALNAFWFVPFVLAYGGMPRPPWPRIPALAIGPHMTYENWSELVGALTAPRLAITGLGLGLAVYGCAVLCRSLNRRIVTAFALAAAFAFVLKFFGSFVPVLVQFQPARFLVPGFALLTLPVGAALAALAKQTRLPSGLCAVGVILLMVPAALWLGQPLSLPLPPSPDPLADFAAQHTTAMERLLIESKRDYEPKIFALAFQREVIGHTFPVLFDPAQFRRHTLWGRHLSAWSPTELYATLERWGIAWVLAHSKEALSLLAQATGNVGETVGEYQAFRMPGPPTKFLVGQGQVIARVNRLELTGLRPENGLIVLRYRYHPAWQTTAGLPISQYPIPEDPSGFLALRNPPESITLSFHPWAMLRAPWP